MSKFKNPSLLAPGERVTDDQLASEVTLLSYERTLSRFSRRSALAGLGVATAALGASALTGCSDNGPLAPVTTTPPVTGTSVVDVLNFALNLEYLEASFYAYISSGNGLNSSLTGTSPGTVSGGAKVNFSDGFIGLYAGELASHEAAHVAFLRTTIMSLGGTPVSLPALNLAAMGAVTNDSSFVIAARQLETVGVSAYEGAIASLVSNTAVLTAAAQIHDLESIHESTLRQLCIVNGFVSPAVDSADVPPTAATVFNTSPTTGLYSAPRTPSQVLAIVYGKAGQTGVSSGGFFPSGMNGNVKTS